MHLLGMSKPISSCSKSNQQPKVEVNSMVWYPSQDVVSVSFSLLPLPQPHWRVFFQRGDSAWFYDHQPHAQFALLDAMNVACQEILPDVCQGCVRHPKRFFPWCRQGRHPLWCWWGKLQFFFLYTQIFLFILCIQIAMFCFVFYCRLQHF